MTAPNPIKGETRFEVEDGRAFVAVFDIDALCAMEDLRDRPAIEFVAMVARGRIGFMVDALWAALRRHHPQLTRAEVAALLPAIKGKKAADLVMDGLRAAFPQPADAEAGDQEGGKTDPPPAPGADGTGQPS